MKVPFFIARRYFFSRNNPSAINIITAISVVGYMVGSFALIVLLSALNGFEKTIFTVYETYYPDLKISPIQGKTMPLDSTIWLKLKKIDGVDAIEPVLEDNAIVSNGEQQVVALIKGVTAKYPRVISTDKLVLDGNPVLQKGDSLVSPCWIGSGLHQKLNLHNGDYIFHVLTPRRESFGVAQLETSETDFVATGLVDPGEELNQKLCIVDFGAASRLFERENVITAYEVKLKKNADADHIKNAVANITQKKCNALLRQEQNEAVYKMFTTEKWVAVGLMAFILLIISFNLLGSLTILIMEKKNDIRLLQSIGLRKSGIKKLFVQQGLLVALVGTIIGLSLGIVAVLLQQKYGFIKTHAMFSLEYPVLLKWSDILIIFLISLALGLATSLYPALKAESKN